jgi:hypothetical protein
MLTVVAIAVALASWGLYTVVPAFRVAADACLMSALFSARPSLFS